MFGKPPFFIPDTGAVDVWNLAAARAWYREKLSTLFPTGNLEKSHRWMAERGVTLETCHGRFRGESAFSIAGLGRKYERGIGRALRTRYYAGWSLRMATTDCSMIFFRVGR